MIIEVDLYSKIRLLYFEGGSIRLIATRLGVSRQTVKKYCEDYTHPDVIKSYTSKFYIITDDVKAFILDCFLHDEKGLINTWMSSDN